MNTEPATKPEKKSSTASIDACAAALAASPRAILPTPRQIKILTHLANITARAGIGDRRPERNFALFLKGLECGIPAMEALESITLSDDGKMSMNASLMHAKLLESGRGRIIWLERTAERVTGRFIRNDDPDNPIDITWSMNEEAQEAGLASKMTWKKYPRQLLTARVISEGCQLVFPDVETARSCIPDELGSDEDVGIEELDSDFADTTPERFKAATTAPAKTNGNTQGTQSTPQTPARFAPAATTAAESNKTATSKAPATATTPSTTTPATSPATPFDTLRTIQVLVQWAGLTREEWLTILKPYGVISAKQLDGEKLRTLTQSLFDRFTPFELRAAGLNTKEIAAAGFKIGDDQEDHAEGKSIADGEGQSTSEQNSASNATAPLAA